MLDLGLQEFDKFSLPEKLVGERVTLLRRDHTHDQELFELIDRSRDFLRKYLFWIDTTKSLQDVRVVTDIFTQNWDANRSFEYVFADTQTGKLVGAGGIHTIDYMNRWGEWGYYLDHQAAGHGYVSEVIQLLERELFARGLHRLVISCDTENTASIAVAKRNGYQQEAHFHECKLAYGQWRDNYLFAKLKPTDK